MTPVAEHAVSPGSSSGSLCPFPAEAVSADAKLTVSFD